VPSALKDDHACIGVSGVIALFFIFLCVGLMTILCCVSFLSDILSNGVCFSVS
jgi:hypothetical protein